MAERVVASTEQVTQPRVTPDGKEILYISTPKSGGQEAPSSIFAIHTDGGVPRLVLKDVGIFTVQCPTVPSATCLYGTVKGGKWETFRFDVKSGKGVGDSQIDPESNWSLSPDGSQRAIVPYHPEQDTIQLRPTSTICSKGNGVSSEPPDFVEANRHRGRPSKISLSAAEVPTGQQSPSSRAKVVALTGDHSSVYSGHSFRLLTTGLRLLAAKTLGCFEAFSSIALSLRTGTTMPTDKLDPL